MTAARSTPAIARASYIDPRVIKAYMVTNDLAKVRAAVKGLLKAEYFTPDEHCVLNLLEKST